MKDKSRRSVFLFLVIFCWYPSALGAGEAKKVRVFRTPDGGIQPQAVTDDRGVCHLVCFKGDPSGGNLFYVKGLANEGRFSRPVRVNSQRGSAIAIGTIRGGQLALGKAGRVHVAWNGSGKALPKGPGRGSPMLYARLNNRGDAFEEQRNLMHRTEFLDGGGTVTADRSGNVYVAWHAKKIDGPGGEGNRRVWLACSRDDGRTFAEEIPAFDKATGACGCCGMHGFTDAKGNSYFIYRAATEAVHRDMWLLMSADHAKSFQGSLLHKWDIDSCPMSSQSFAEGPEGIYMAWDTKGQVYFAKVKSGSLDIGSPVAAPGEGRGRKHPALAVNSRGEMILAWTEGTGWQRGGSLAWQVYDAKGNPTAERGRLPGAVPVWGLATAVAAGDGTFLLFH